MANSDTPWGLAPIHFDEAADCHYYPVTNNYGTALYVNDPVVRVNAGTIERASTGDGAPILGSIIALFVQNGVTSLLFPDNLTPVQYMAATPGASLQYWALVCDNPNVYFAAQEDGDTDDLAFADIGDNVNIIFTHAGNATTGISGMEIDSNTEGTGATKQLKLMWQFDHIEPASNVRTALGDYCKWVVKINNHQLAPNTAGI